MTPRIPRRRPRRRPPAVGSQHRSVLLPGDALRLGATGIVTRPGRAVLSALGVAIGIAAMVAVVGISASSQAQLAATLDRLGTNLLTVTPGTSLMGEETPLPVTSGGLVSRIPGVERVATSGVLEGRHAYRSDAVLVTDTNGLTVATGSADLPEVLGALFAAGSWFTDGTAAHPVVVLGAVAAEKLGISRPGQTVLIGSEPHTVTGILGPVELAPEADLTVFVGEGHGAELAGEPVSPTTVYLRALEERIDDVRSLVPRTVSPQTPGDVTMGRPSDALAAKQASDQAFTGMLVGLGSVALLVGGIGVANTMVISVLERRREIGLRRALGATRAHVRRQFLSEAVLLSLVGGSAGVIVGIAATAAFALSGGLPVTVPAAAVAGGLGATVAVGAIAGLYPAARAARTPPTEALRS